MGIKTPLSFMTPSRISYVPMAVGVPTVIAMAEKLFFYPITTNVDFLLFTDPFFFKILNLCYITIISVSPFPKEQDFSNKATKFSMKVLFESTLLVGSKNLRET